MLRNESVVVVNVELGAFATPSRPLSNIKRYNKVPDLNN